jgi:hypothetical protein
MLAEAQFQQSEIVTLLMTIVLTPVVVSQLRRVEIPGRWAFFAAYFSIAVAYVATVAEGVLLPDAFNILEHGGIAFAGVFIAAGLWAITRSLPGRGDGR